MWELDHKEGWALKNWCFRTVVLEKTLESLLNSKEIKPVNPKGNQPWIFIGRTDTEAVITTVWPADTKSQLIGKDPETGKDWRQKGEGGSRGREHHWLNGHEFEQTLGDSGGQGSLACCSPQGCRVRHNLATEQQPPVQIFSVKATEEVSSSQAVWPSRVHCSSPRLFVSMGRAVSQHLLTWMGLRFRVFSEYWCLCHAS